MLPTSIVNVTEPKSPLTLDALSEAVGPDEEETEGVRETVPVKPFFGAILIAVVPLSPGFIESEFLLVVRSKSGVPVDVTVTWTVIGNMCVRLPPLPVTRMT